VILVAAPFWLTGRLDRFAGAYLRATEAYPRVSVNAYNAWYVTGETLPSGPDTAPFIAGLTYRVAGLLGLLLVLCLALWHLRPRDHRWRRLPGPALAPRWLLGAAATYLAFFMLPTQIHERYLYPVLPLLCLLFYAHPLLVLAYAILSVTFFFNLVRVVPWDPGAVDWLTGAGWTAERIAVLNLVALALLLLLLLFRPERSLSRQSWDGAARAVGLALLLTVLIANAAVQLGGLGAGWPRGAAANAVWLFVVCLGAATGGTWIAGRLRRGAPQSQPAPEAAGAVLGSRR
jgi:hypothetical protein